MYIRNTVHKMLYSLKQLNLFFFFSFFSKKKPAYSYFFFFSNTHTINILSLKFFCLKNKNYLFFSSRKILYYFYNDRYSLNIYIYTYLFFFLFEMTKIIMKRASQYICQKKRERLLIT